MLAKVPELAQQDISNAYYFRINPINDCKWQGKLNGVIYLFEIRTKATATEINVMRELVLSGPIVRTMVGHC